MCADVHLIEGAVVLGAHVVGALLNGAVNVRVFLIVHGNGSFRCGILAA